MGRRRASVIAAVALVGCGRVGFDSIDDVDPDEASVFDAVPLMAGGEAWLVATTPADPNRVYAVAGGRVFRSIDRAATWTDCRRTRMTNVVAPDPGDALIVYLGDDDGLWRSADACATWTQIASVDDVEQIAFSGTDVLFGGNGIWRLRGGIATKLPSPLDGGPLAGLAVMGNTILAANWADGIARSTDNGASFSPANAGLSVAHAAGLAFPIPGNDQVVLVQTETGTYRSTNGGVSWSSSPGSNDGRDTVVVDPADPSFIVGATWNGMIHSTDGGVSFDGTNMRTPNMDNAHILDFAFEPGGGGRVYTATTRGVFVAADHGLAWTSASVGIDAWSIGEMTKVDGQPVLYATTSAGLLQSTDDGETWSNFAAGMEFRTSQLQFVHLSANTPGQLWSGGSPWLWRSTDSGKTFAENAQVGATDGWEIHVLRTVPPARVWKGTSSRLWHSDDNGASWLQNEIDPGGRYVHDLVIDPAGELWVATHAGLYHSGDDGLSFELAATTALDREVLTLLRLADGTLVMGTTDGVHAGTDAGWVRAGLSDTAVFDVIADGPRWIAATSDGVYLTSDRGATWTELPGLALKRPVSLLIDNAGRLLVGTDGYGLFRTALP